MQELEQYLWNMTVDELKRVKQKLDLKKVGSTKLDLIASIMNFYQTPNWLEDYFKTLSGFEKEYATLIVQENFCPIPSEVKELILKYNIKVNWDGRFDDNLKFIVNGYVPEVFKPVLLKLVPPKEVLFKKIQKLETNEDSILLENPKNPIKKFDDFLVFINKNKVKATEKNNYVSKSSIMKFIQEYNIFEIVRKEDNSLEEMKNQNDTIVVNGIASLLMCCSVITIKNGYFTLGSNYSKYIKLSSIEKAKFLLDEYIKSDYLDINEIERLTNYLFKFKAPLNLSVPRKTILEFVKKMPVGEWVSTEEIKYFIRVKDSRFLRNNVREILQKYDYENWYYSPNYDDLEYSFIDTVLMDYLAVLGIIDVYIAGVYNDQDTRFYMYTDFAKITDFGAYVLGLVDNFKIEEKALKPLIITPNFEIIVEDGLKRMEYELYLDRFFEKKVEDDAKSIYKLDFAGVAKSLNMEEFSLFSYLLTECPDVPKCVLEKFADWSKTLGKICIRNVTILEAPENIMKVLLQDPKIQKIESKEKSAHIIIPSKKSNELKKIIEEKEYFCEIDD